MLPTIDGNRSRTLARKPLPAQAEARKGTKREAFMSSVFVVDTEYRPLNPLHPGEARRLLSAGKAAVWRHYPFTLILKRAVPEAEPELLRMKLDPGSKMTGLALVNDATGQVVWAGELAHRGQVIRDALLTRRTIRRARRQRYTRYRPKRFANRRRPVGWLPPSLASRISNILTWVQFASTPNCCRTRR